MITPQEIRAARQQTGMTQMQVAINVGVSHPAYRLWEMGGTKPKAENEQKLREVLKIEEATKHGGNRRSK